MNQGEGMQFAAVGRIYDLTRELALGSLRQLSVPLSSHAESDLIPSTSLLY
jgi:hypothetical protein